ncbi:MAG TPA: ABC transporter substrate-binding protein [Candidatus Bathyarchaeia archaeon]|nr:ABC transporter substrate-binding protein [Candidatus Bathyarchaeia archaeon]
MKLLAIMLAMVVVVASSFSQVSGQAVSGPRYGGTFVVALDGDPDTLNPSITTSTYPQQIGGLMFSNLLSYDMNFKPHPDLAQSWDVATDGLTYTFHLVHNATFHDGYPLTSADVKFTYSQVLPKYMSTMVKPLSFVSSIDTPDNYTVVFHLSKPYTPLFLLLSTPNEGGGILPVHLYSGTNFLTNPNNYAPIGTGPFKFAEWKKGQYVRVVRNNNYFKAGQPYLDQIIFKVIPDPTTRALALQNGDVNFLWFYTLPSSEVPRLRADPNLVYKSLVPAAPDEVMMFPNARNRILNNTDVRHALNYAINKTELVQKVTFGLAKEARGPIPSAYGPAAFNPNLPAPEYSVSKANQLLDKAGYPRQANGTRFSLELTWIVTLGEMGRAAELIKSQLALVGVNVRLAPRDRATLIDTVFNRWHYDLFMHSMGTDPLPDVGVARLYVSSNIGHNAFNNAEAYSNATIDSLWSDAATTTDPVKRTQDLYRIQDILVQDMPMIWLWEVNDYSIYTKDFGGVDPPTTSNGAYYFQEVYWTKGSNVSPESAMQAIADAQSKLTALAKQGNNSTAAWTLLQQAQSAYKSGDYATAQSLASQAVQSTGSQGPSLGLYTGVAVIAIVVIVAAILLRKRAQAKKD